MSLFSTSPFGPFCNFWSREVGIRLLGFPWNTWLIYILDPQLMEKIYSSNLLIPKVHELAVSRSGTDGDGTDSENDRGEIREMARQSLNIVMSTYQTLIISVG